MSTSDPAPKAHTLSKPLLIGLILGGVLVVVLAMLGLHLRARARTNHVALSATPKPVTVVKAQAGHFQEQKTYVGMLAPWVSAKIGPQYVSAYASTVLVRPGDFAKQGQVLATLDCRFSAAESRATAARAVAIEQRQVATQHESQRVEQLIHGGFASPSGLDGGPGVSDLFREGGPGAGPPRRAAQGDRRQRQRPDLRRRSLRRHRRRHGDRRAVLQARVRFDPHERRLGHAARGACADLADVPVGAAGPGPRQGARSTVPSTSWTA